MRRLSAAAKCLAMKNMETNPYIIPAEILEAATKVSLFFKQRNSRGWQLLDICDRIYAEKTTCPNCGNNRQVWVNQITNKLTCHRVGCNNLEL